jgi:integrase/recombinase XerC
VNEHESALPALGEDYLAHLTFERRLSPLTVKNYRRDLLDLSALSGGLSGDAKSKRPHDKKARAPTAIPIESVTAQDVRRFIATKHAEGMTPRALARLLSGWRGFFKYRLQHGVGHLNPCDGVRAPKAAKRLPQVLSPDEAVSLVSFEDDSFSGKRDRAAFELLYSCGLRIAELTGMNLDSIDWGSREVRVTGKGNKTRIVPIGKPALDSIKAWLDVRAVARGASEPALFLGVQGKRLHASVLERSIKRWAKQQGIEIDVHPHMLRHSFASHVLQSSQNLRAVQEMMGHASIASTQVYTHLDFQHLAKVYDAAHPRAKRKK